MKRPVARLWRFFCVWKGSKVLETQEGKACTGSSLRMLSPERNAWCKFSLLQFRCRSVRHRHQPTGETDVSFPPPGLALCLPHRAGLPATSELLWGDNRTRNALAFLPP